MRKKAHRRINANNSEYDRFYIINYLVKTFVSISQVLPEYVYRDVFC